MPPMNCYCGQKDENSLNVLECMKCRRLCHEGCTKCLDIPMLLGDKFYIFICSVCNAGSEYLGRIELKWQEIAHLLLYNLTIQEKKKYFNLDGTLVPFLRDNWERFRIMGPVASEKKDIHIKLLENLQNCHDRFKCGKEVKKSKNIWALRVRVPPEPPDVLPSAARLEKDVVVWDFQVKDREYHIISVKKCGKTSSKRFKTKLSLPSSASQKNGEVSKCHGSVALNENGTLKTKQRSRCATVSFSEDCACYGLLDSLIPFPADFYKCSNPFETSSSKCLIKCPSSAKDAAPQKGRKRNLDHSFDTNLANGKHELSEGRSLRKSIFIFTKDMKFQISKDFCVMGKRITSTGEIEYLFQRNR